MRPALDISSARRLQALILVACAAGFVALAFGAGLRPGRGAVWHAMIAHVAVGSLIGAVAIVVAIRTAVAAIRARATPTQPSGERDAHLRQFAAGLLVALLLLAQGAVLPAAMVGGGIGVDEPFVFWIVLFLVWEGPALASVLLLEVMTKLPQPRGPAQPLPLLGLARRLVGDPARPHDPIRR
jgi:hypothetical protein